MCALFSIGISFGFGSIFTAIKDCIFGKASYIWDLEDNLDALKKELQDLTHAKEDVIAIAEQQKMRWRLNEVRQWLKSVQDVETQADGLLRVKSQEIEKLCLGGYCSRNPKSSYEFGKKVANLLKELEGLKVKRATFVDLAERIPEDPVDKRPSEQASYICDLEDNLDALKKALQDLTQAKEDVNRRIAIAEQQQMRWRLKQVQQWLTRVQDVETQADELLRVKSQEIENLRGYCSRNPKSSCEFGKKVANLLKILEDLKGATFVDVAERIPEDPVDERPSEPTVGLDSKFDQVWSYISDKQVKIIGLYGKGGVGKTTLLTQINNKFLSYPNDFVVIWVLVSKDLRLENIQETIMKKIGFLNEEWKCKPFAEKAMDIFKILSRRKFVLLLDDIWEWVNLIAIGIPPPSQEIDFKVVFTTRSEEVCSLMETHKKVEVVCLSHAEAWILFQEKVGKETLDSHPGILTVAEDVARQCGGLPLAVITIGRAMAGKNQPEEWKHDESILRMSAHEFPGMEDHVYCLLKFSYDRLPSDIHRSCFLYCSLFPEDYEILKSELIDCWLSEGFLKKDDGISARYVGHSIIGFLLRACLLEKGDTDEMVRMHDVIRDMALWIACEIEKEKEKFLVCSGVGLTTAPDVRKWENVKRMSLMKNDIENLSGTPNCHELLTLFLQCNRLKMLTSGFFGQMIHLKVLNLSQNYDLTELPVGISELVELQHLDLSETGIVELPEELKALTNLKCLNLEYTDSLRKIPRNVISNLSMLQVLRMFRRGSNWFESKDSNLFDEGELFMEELVCLEHLNVLSINFKNSHTLGRCLSCPVLQNCAVESVSIQLNDGSKSLNVLSLGVLKDLGYLHIRSKDLAELVIDREMRNVPQFYSLYNVELFGCSKLRDATWLVFAPNLKFLWINGCDEMKEIISVEGEVGEMMGNQLPFPRLQRLLLDFLPKLEIIYCNPLPFPHLKGIHIIQCPKLKKLPLGANSIMTSRSLEITGEEDWWNELQWEDQTTHDHFLPFFIPSSIPI